MPIQLTSNSQLQMYSVTGLDEDFAELGDRDHPGGHIGSTLAQGSGGPARQLGLFPAQDLLRLLYGDVPTVGLGARRRPQIHDDVEDEPREVVHETVREMLHPPFLASPPAEGAHEGCGEPYGQVGPETR